MDIVSLLIFLGIGAIAGFLAGMILKGRGFGLIGNIVVGVLGAFVGGYLFSVPGIAMGGLLGTIVSATAGACVLLLVIGVLRKAT